MTRHRRKEFSKETQRLAYERSGGYCESERVPVLREIGCRQRLATGNVFYDHVDADFFSSDNSLSNCAALCRACNRIKTDLHDAPKIAKSKRVSDRNRGIRDPWRKRLPGSKDDPYKMKLNQLRATPVDRRTGEYWRSGR